MWMEMNAQLFAVFLVYLEVCVMTGNIDTSKKTREIWLMLLTGIYEHEWLKHHWWRTSSWMKACSPKIRFSWQSRRWWSWHSSSISSCIFHGDDWIHEKGPTFAPHYICVCRTWIRWQWHRHGRCSIGILMNKKERLNRQLTCKVYIYSPFHSFHCLSWDGLELQQRQSVQTSAVLSVLEQWLSCPKKYKTLGYYMKQTLTLQSASPSTFVAL